MAKSFDEQIAELYEGLGIQPEPEEPAEEESTEEAKKPQNDPRIDEVLASVKSTDMLAQMLTDPVFAEVMRARQEGRQVRVVDANQQQQQQQQSAPATQPQEPDWESMTPKQIAEYSRQQTLNEFRQMLPTLMKDQLAPVQEQLSQVHQFVQQQTAQAAKSQVEEARKKFPDFDQYVPQMRQMAQENPGLTAEELYLIAATRAGKPITRQSEIETERPTQQSARPGIHTTRKTPLPPGRAGLSQALDEVFRSGRIKIQ